MRSHGRAGRRRSCRTRARGVAEAGHAPLYISRTGRQSPGYVSVIADRYDAFLFDLDGVLYRGPVRAGGGGRGVTAPDARQARCVRHEQLGPHPRDGRRAPSSRRGSRRGRRGGDVRPHHGVAARPAGIASAYVVGEEGIRRALAEAGVEVVDGEPDRVDVVVVGWDRRADYASLRTASVLVQGGAPGRDEPRRLVPRRRRDAMAGCRSPARGDRDHHGVQVRWWAPEPAVARGPGAGRGRAAPADRRPASTPISPAPSRAAGIRSSCSPASPPRRRHDRPIRPTYVGTDISALFDDRH